MNESKYSTIMIFGAMDVETEFTVSMLKDVKKNVIGGYPFYEGIYEGKKIIVCRTFTGMENSAAATAIGILNYNPDCIISQGTSGGHDPELHKNDIVIGKKLFNISSFKTNRHGKNDGIHPEQWKLMEWDISESQEQKEIPFIESDKALVEIAFATEYSKGRLVIGNISSSNNWNCELDRINMLHKMYGSSCEEMESYAATQIARRFEVPAVTIRIISNSEQHAGEEYERTVGQTCQEFVLDFIKKIQN